MASIDEIILRSTNPFDRLRSVNFWQQQQPEPIVESIHQEAIATITATLAQVAQDHHTRTILLDGDSGSGKTYALGRLKKVLNHQAFFAYIPAFPQSDHIWRHILRYTVDSLVQVPEGQQDSQLQLWLNSVLSAIKQRSIKERILKDDVLDLLRSDRQKFINKLKSVYKQAGIYNADDFFGVLHDLINPELDPLACEWLRGDSLSEESQQTLKVKTSIDSEEAARGILANFGRIATDTRPIVLCFDELENIACLPNGSLDLQSLFKVSTKIHNEDRSFLIIISILTNTWNNYKNCIDQPHKARINQTVSLGLINFEQAESLFASRLYSLHYQANPLPTSSIYPLSRQYLEEAFPGGKTNPGDVFWLGRDVFQAYKLWLFENGNKPFKFQAKIDPVPSLDLIAEFKLKWRDEFAKSQQKITKIRFLSSPELIQMLQEALAALQVEEIKIPLLTGTYASYSLDYQLAGKSGRLGVVWTEDANMITFCHVIKACQKAIENDPSLTLRLIRAEGLGSQNNQGYKLFKKIFTGSPHCLIAPNLSSVHYLAAYYSLVKDAREGDLVIAGITIGLKKLQTLIRDYRILHDCPLLQDLKIVNIPESQKNKTNENSNNGKQNIVKIATEVIAAKECLVEIISTQKLIGREVLIQNTRLKCPTVTEIQIKQLIQQLCQEKQVKILDPQAKPEAQLICLVPRR